MTNKNQTYKSIFLVVVLIFGVACLYGVKTDETPRFILFLGRFHPLLLHLPIGALIVTFFIDLKGRIQKKYPEDTIKALLGFTALFATITCFLGYFLSLEGGYQKSTLNFHFYTGIITALFVNILFFISLRPSFKSNTFFLPLFVITLISISIAGHYGSVLTHGDNFLTEYMSVSKDKKLIETIDSLKIYEDVVVKILDKKCIQCHNTSKQKGELSLISRNQILKGGKTGLSVISGNASKSKLYSRLLLPISDKKHMPPEGKEQLTKDEIWLIKHWINNGLDFKNYATTISKNDTLHSKLKNYLVFNNVEIPRASQDAIEEVKLSGFRVLDLVPGQAELNIKYLDKIPSKESIDKLSVLKEQIIELDFNNTEITDEMISGIKILKNLKSLRLNSPLITDKTIENLKALKNLEVLNIYNTNISDDGLTDLLNTIKPKRIYSWNTKVNQDIALKLANKFNIKIQNSIISGFVEDSQLEPPLIISKKTLFTDTIHINSISKIKDVDIRYTLDGNIPDSTSSLFDQTLILNSSKTLKVAAFKKGWEPSDVITQKFSKINFNIKDFSILNPPDKRYPNSSKLFDLKEGSLDFKDGNWVGYYGNDLSVSLDLGELKLINNISVSCLKDVASWILFPTDLIIYVSKTKNGTYKKLANLKIPEQNKLVESKKDKFSLSLPKTKGRFFKIIIKNRKELPDWHISAGNPSWLFVDEIFFW